MNHTPGNADNRGFTLLEILLAFLIFSLIIGTLYASYSSSFTTVNRTESRLETFRKAAIAMDRISGDLQAAYISPWMTDSTGVPSGVTRFVGQDNEINGNEADSMSFFSRLEPLFGDNDYPVTGQLVSYEVVEADNEGELLLLRSEHGEFVDLSLEREGLPLCDGLQAVRFTFVDDEGETHDSWDSDSEDFSGFMPRMVTVSLAFVNRENPEAPLVFETGIVLPPQYVPRPQNGITDSKSSGDAVPRGLREPGRAFLLHSGNIKEII